MSEEPNATTTPASDAPAASAPPAADAAVPSTTPAPKKSGSGSDSFTWGVGRRKTAVARVRIRPGKGEFKINTRDVNEFFRLIRDQSAVRTPLDVTKSTKSVDVFVNVRGGGVTGQAGAVSLGLARALAKYNSEHDAVLREHHLLTRDARKVERKKYGQPGARKRFQFSKR